MRAALAGLALVCGAAVSAAEFTTLKGHGGPVMALAVSPDGRVASASFDNSVGLWRGRVPQWLEGHAAAVTALAWGPGGLLASGGDDFAVRLWQVEVEPEAAGQRRTRAGGGGGVLIRGRARPARVLALGDCHEAPPCSDGRNFGSAWSCSMNPVSLSNGNTWDSLSAHAWSNRTSRTNQSWSPT